MNFYFPFLSKFLHNLAPLTTSHLSLALGCKSYMLARCSLHSQLSPLLHPKQGHLENQLPYCNIYKQGTLFFASWEPYPNFMLL